jgi:CRP/FNR family transcriptional regulator, cyclic AMP receptor protein
MTPTLALGWLAASLTLVAFFMKTMIPLRRVAIAANVCFVVYGSLAGAWHVLALHGILLPFNVVRLREMMQLTEKVRVASQGDLNMDWLKPFMSRRAVQAGEVLFRKGEVANALYFTVSGRYRLVEIDTPVPMGQVVGEIGLIAPDNRRTLTLECVEAGEILTISYGQVKQLYYQNPQFGFFFLQLISERLFRDIRRLEERLAGAV